MQPMTKRERMYNTLHRKPVDHCPCCESLWGETTRRYREEGHLVEGVDTAEHFGFDCRSGGWLNSTADLDFEPVVLEETEDTKLVLDGNGARLRRHKKHSSTPEHVGFSVEEREAWEEKIKPHLIEVDRRRVPWEGYRNAKAKAAENEEFFFWAGVAPFEQMHPVCGHEFMLMGMAEDPEWVKDMVMTYADFTIKHLETLFAEEGEPDGMWFYEDMGFKERPFMSPAMYEEIMQPGHKRLFDFAHARGLKVVVHSCGFVEPLLPGLVEAGMDVLQAMEVKAGMNMPRIAERFGDRIGFCGNLDVRELISNDRGRIDAEMKKKIPPVLEKGAGFIIHSDHSIPPEVDYDTLVYFFEHGRELTAEWLQG